MKYWLLGIACVLYGVTVALLRHFDPPAARIALFAAYLLPAVAGFVTAMSYRARDRLRWAWLAFAAGYAVAFVSKTALGDNADIVRAGPARQATWSLFIALFNAGIVVGLSLFARVWSGTGMAPPWRRWATLGFFVVAIAIGIPNGRAALALLSPVQPLAIGVAASVLGDILSITLIGPIFATMVALRGGVLARPWIFLFASVLCWLINNLPPLLPANVAITYDGIVRPAAITFAAAAAIAQLWVKRQLSAELAD
jgi:hypothetical protein